MRMLEGLVNFDFIGHVLNIQIRKVCNINDFKSLKFFELFIECNFDFRISTSS